jgi:hypothetical protein
MVQITMTEDEAKKVADWLQESFNLLEVGGLHRNAAFRLMESINKELL